MLFLRVGRIKKSPLGVKGDVSFNIGNLDAYYFNFSRINDKFLRNAVISEAALIRRRWQKTHIVGNCA